MHCYHQLPAGHRGPDKSHAVHRPPMPALPGYAFCHGATIVCHEHPCVTTPAMVAILAGGTLPHSRCRLCVRFPLPLDAVGKYSNLLNQGSCSWCSNGNTYQDQTGQSLCKDVSDCQGGFFVGAAPTLSADRTCTACDTGSFSSSTNAGAVARTGRACFLQPAYPPLCLLFSTQ